MGVRGFDSRMKWKGAPISLRVESGALSQLENSRLTILMDSISRQYLDNLDFRLRKSVEGFSMQLDGVYKKPRQLGLTVSTISGRSIYLSRITIRGARIQSFDYLTEGILSAVSNRSIITCYSSSECGLLRVDSTI